MSTLKMKRIGGTLFILLYLFIAITGIIRHLRVSNDNRFINDFAVSLSERMDVDTNDPDIAAKLLAEAMLAQRLFLLSLLVYPLPLLLWGGYWLLGSEHAMWRWQQFRSGRKPLWSYVCFVFALASLHIGLGKALTHFEAKGGATANLALAVLLAALAAWFYIGRRIPWNKAEQAALAGAAESNISIQGESDG